MTILGNSTTKSEPIIDCKPDRIDKSILTIGLSSALKFGKIGGFVVVVVISAAAGLSLINI